MCFLAYFCQGLLYCVIYFLSLSHIWGLQDTCSFHLICRACPTFWKISEVNDDPLSLWMLWGSPNLGIISLSTSFATSVTFSDLVGYTSTHPKKCPQKNSKNLKFPLVLGICGKSTYQSSNKHNPLYCSPFFTGMCSVSGLSLAHTWQAYIILWMVLGKWGSSNVA